MKRKTIALLMAILLVFAFAGCSKPESPQSSDDFEIIIEEQTIIEGGSMTQGNSSTTQNNESADSPVSSENPTTSSQVSDDKSGSSKQPTSSQGSSVISTTSEPETINIDYEWKSHSEDFKLLAFTFDDGPSSLMQEYVKYFAAFEGAGTFFVNGHKITNDNAYNQMQEAINYGWEIGNHGERHLVATTGGVNGGEATYDEIKADINTLTNRLESKLNLRDGSPYKVSCYRPPNVKPTENTFKICGEENLAVIWLKNDVLDWGSNTKQASLECLKKGIGTWKDGDIILCHETSYNTYEILEQLLPEYFRAGYRFCSITELMELRGIKLEQISGELNDVDGNKGMVTNIIEAAKQGKK